MNAGKTVSLCVLAIVVAAPSHGPADDLFLASVGMATRPSVLQVAAYGKTGKETSIGTGFLLSSDGKLVTNRHVIDGAETIVAKSENGAIFTVESVIATDAASDLAILQVRGKGLPCLELAKSSVVAQGDRIAVVGNPLGLQGSLSDGIVSAVRVVDGRKVFQITAPISAGSSGSPVLNHRGQVVGVAYASLVDGQSINFATPSDDIVRLLQDAAKAPTPLKTPTSVSRRESWGPPAWGKTRWGMTVADLAEIFPNDDFRPVPEDRIARQDGQRVIMATLAQCPIAEHKYNVFFVGDRKTRQLIEISILPDPADVKVGLVRHMLLDLPKNLMQKYGRPETSKGTFPESTMEYTWRVGETVILLSGYGYTGESDLRVIRQTEAMAGIRRTLQDEQRRTDDYRRQMIESHHLTLRYVWQKSLDDNL